MTWAIWIPLGILGTLLVLLGLTAVLGRVAEGRYLRAIMLALAKVPVLRRVFQRMSTAALARENPQLASAVRKLGAFGTPTTPEAAQRALARLTPAERRAYLEAVGQQAEMPAAPNRAARRQGRTQPSAPARRGQKRRRR